MLTADLRTTGFPETLAKYDKIMSNLPKMEAVTIESILRLGYNVAHGSAPERTGFLKRNIGWIVQSHTTGTLYSDAFYSEHVNYGTSKMQSRPYFSLADNEMSTQAPSIAAEISDVVFMKVQDPHVLNIIASKTFFAHMRRTHGARQHAKHARRYSSATRGNAPFTGARRYTQLSGISGFRIGQQHYSAGRIVRRKGAFSITRGRKQ
jgi:hypothetical protein